MKKNVMYHFKKSDGGIVFIGYNDDEKVYSRQYYANVGIMNTEESTHTSLRAVKKLTQSCIDLGYKEVDYLPR